MTAYEDDHNYKTTTTTSTANVLGRKLGFSKKTKKKKKNKN